jgi:hypothetical protein
MELIPLIHLALVAAVLLSLSSLVVAFFSRRFARFLAVSAVGCLAAFVLLILKMNRWQYDDLPRALRAAPSVTYFAAGALAVALVGGLFPLAPKGDTPTPAVKWSRRFVLTFVGFPLLCLACYGGWWLRETQRGGQKTHALLNGDPGARIKRLQLDSQMRRVICTDPAVLRYLEECFRASDSKRRARGGYYYDLTVEYEGGGRDSFYTDWFKGGVSVSPGDYDDGPRYVIAFSLPLPPDLEEVVRFLRKPHQEVQGQVLIVEPGGTHHELDRSLIPGSDRVAPIQRQGPPVPD